MLTLIALCVIAGIVVISYLCPNSGISEFMNFTIDYIPLLIVVLTAAYVNYASHQVNVMNKQLSVMEKQINAQVQPIIVPDVKFISLGPVVIKNLYSDYSSPRDTSFAVQEKIGYPLSIEAVYENKGNGTGLNTIIYFWIDGLDDLVYLGKSEIPPTCISEKRPEFVSFFVNDDCELVNKLRSVTKRSSSVHSKGIRLKITTLCENVFGHGVQFDSVYRLYDQSDDTPADTDDGVYGVNRIKNFLDSPLGYIRKTADSTYPKGNNNYNEGNRYSFIAEKLKEHEMSGFNTIEQLDFSLVKTDVIFNKFDDIKKEIEEGLKDLYINKLE